jgi:hypothetical protein
MNRSVLFLFLSLVACGSGERPIPSGPVASAPQSTSTEANAAYAVADFDSLPACTAQRLGQLFYVEQTNTFVACVQTGWQMLGMNGRDGKDGVNGTNGVDGTNGKDGAAGATGPTGKDGTSFAATSRTDCQTVQNDTTLGYEAVRFTDGSLFVSCRAASFDHQDSFAAIHSAGSAGSTSGMCFVTHDTSAPANRGQWTFRLAPLQVSYEDQLSTSNGYTYVFTSINCTTLP